MKNSVVLKNIVAMLLGSLFSVGLMFSGMSNPKKVLDFLDISGNWDASLAFVMGGAILVAFLPFQYAIRTQKTIFNEQIDLPKATQVDPKLLIGALLFGIGWGISGICPAPALTLIGLGYYQALYFIVAMFASMYVYAKTIGKT